MLLETKYPGGYCVGFELNYGRTHILNLASELSGREVQSLGIHRAARLLEMESNELYFQLFSGL